MSTAETISCYWIGQVSIKQLEKFLWLLEKCSQWSLPPPDDTEKDLALVRPQLTRPLPWILFIPVLALLRVWRETISFTTVMCGGEPYTASHMVKYLQNYRRTLRAVKYHGIRYRRIQKQALTEEQKESNVNKSMWLNWLNEMNVFKNTETECSKEVTSPDVDDPESTEKNDNQTSKKRPLADDDDYIKADSDDDDDWEDDDEDDFNPDEALQELASKVEALESDPEDPDFSGVSDESSGEDSVSEDDEIDEEVLAEEQNINSNMEKDGDAETHLEIHSDKELKNSADDGLDTAKEKECAIVESNNHDTSSNPDNEKNFSSKSDKLNGIEKITHQNNGTKSNIGKTENDNFTRNEQTDTDKFNNKKEESANIEKSVSKKEESKNIEKSVDNKKESTQILEVEKDKPINKNNVKEVVAKISGADNEKKVQIQSSLPVYKTEKFNFNHKNNFGNIHDNNVQFKDGKFTNLKSSAKTKSETFLEAEKHFTEIASKAQDVCISPAIQKTGVHQEKSNENLQKN